MTTGSPHASEVFRECEARTLRIHQLIALGKTEADETNDLRQEVADRWEELSPANLDQQTS